MLKLLRHTVSYFMHMLVCTVAFRNISNVIQISFDTSYEKQL